MGIYPEVSLKLARRRRDEARKLLAQDIDLGASIVSLRRMFSPTLARSRLGKTRHRGLPHPDGPGDSERRLVAVLNSLPAGIPVWERPARGEGGVGEQIPTLSDADRGIPKGGVAPVHGRKLQVGIAAPATVMQSQGMQRHAASLARTSEWRFRGHALRCLMCTHGSALTPAGWRSRAWVKRQHEARPLPPGRHRLRPIPIWRASRPASDDVLH